MMWFFFCAGMKVEKCSSEMFTPSSRTMLIKSNKPNTDLLSTKNVFLSVCVLTAGCYQHTHVLFT